jgi:hypothetical protein
LPSQRTNAIARCAGALLITSQLGRASIAGGQSHPLWWQQQTGRGQGITPAGWAGRSKPRWRAVACSNLGANLTPPVDLPMWADPISNTEAVQEVLGGQHRSQKNSADEQVAPIPVGFRPPLWSCGQKNLSDPPPRKLFRSDVGRNPSNRPELARPSAMPHGRSVPQADILDGTSNGSPRRYGSALPSGSMPLKDYWA